MSLVCARVLRTPGKRLLPCLLHLALDCLMGEESLCAFGVGHLLGHWETLSSITQEQITAPAPSPDPSVRRGGRTREGTWWEGI